MALAHSLVVVWERGRGGGGGRGERNTQEEGFVETTLHQVVRITRIVVNSKDYL
jgi:hypothetical protein